MSIQEMRQAFEKNETESIHIAKFNRLAPDEQQLIFNYLYFGTIKKTAQHYKCSTSWCGKKIRTILNNLR